MTWIWLGIVIALAFIEVSTTELVTIWFVVSGLVSLTLSFFIDNFFIEFLVFVLLGMVLLITTRKYLLKFIMSKKEKTNLDRVVGMTAIVTEEIKKSSPGEVKVDGKRWTAISDKKIKVDSTVKVLEIEGVKLKVEEVNE